MIPEGYATAVLAWATSPEISDNERSARQKSLIEQRDALVTGASKGRGVKDLVQASLNGKTFQWDVGVSKAEMLAVLHDVLERLGLVAVAAQAVTTTHANFASLQR